MDKKGPPKKDEPKKPIPGADFVEAKKSSRRRKKTTSKDESSEPGPSSTVASPSPAQPGPRPNLPVQQSPLVSTLTQEPQTPMPTDSRQAGQASSQDGLPIRQGPKEGQSIKDPTNTAPEAGPSEEIQVKHQKRPGPVASKGDEVTLATNYFGLSVKPGLELYRYSITVSPEAKGKKLSQMIKDALLLQIFDALRPGLVSDFAAFLLSRKPLPDDLSKVLVPYKKDTSTKDSNDSKPPAGTKSTITAKDSNDPEHSSTYSVTFGYIRMVEIRNDTKIQTTADQVNLPMVQDLDIVLGHYRKLSSDISMVGKRRAFRLSILKNLSDSDYQNLAMENSLLVAIRGFFSSVRLSTKGFLVNINVTHGTFYKDRYLPEWLQMVQARPEVHSTRVEGLLQGLRVKLCHLSPQVIKTISGFAKLGDGRGYEAHPPKISLPANPRNVQFFEYESTKPTMGSREKEKAKIGQLPAHNPSQCGCNGSYISVYDYFRRKYPSYEITSADQPVVNIGGTNHPSYLPLNACFVLAQPAKVTLSSNETTRMQNFAVRVPHLNAKSISDPGFETLGLTDKNKKLGTLGITIHPDRVKLKGRVLPQPTVMFSQKNATQVDKSKWNLLGMKFTTAADLGNWGCLNLYSGQRPQQCHDDCVRNLVDELTKCGIRTSMPPTTHFNKDSTRVWQNWIRNCRHSLLLVVIPIKEPLLYSQIKKIGDIEAGIPTVCVTGQRNKFYNTAYTKGTPNSASYNANVALKMNIKRGGINHVLKGGQLGFISEGTTMVVGIDVTHPSPGSGSQATSVAAMVASSDKDLAQWPAQIRINPARQEKVDTLNSMLRAHLTYWAKLHGSFPEKLLIYRDGVSEGQYQMVLEEELPTLRAACESVYGKQDLPRITLIVVGKRHHTRFYKTNPRGDILEGPKDGNNPGMQGNPKFGTVIDTEIVDETRNWDFYLQSHTALQGTARPAHYFVLVDEIFKHCKDLKPLLGCETPSDYLYTLTYHMCFLFCRATTSVSIPPPVYYADIACERGRCWNSKVFDSSQSVASEDSEIKEKDVRVNSNLEHVMFYI